MRGWSLRRSVRAHVAVLCSEDRIMYQREHLIAASRYAPFPAEQFAGGGVLPLGRRSLYCGYRIHRSSCMPTGSGAISACADRTYGSSYTRSAELL